MFQSARIAAALTITKYVGTPRTGPAAARSLGAAVPITAAPYRVAWAAKANAASRPERTSDALARSCTASGMAISQRSTLCDQSCTA